MPRIFRRVVKVGVVTLLLGSIYALYSWEWLGKQITDGRNRIKRHNLETDYLGLEQLADVPVDVDNQRWLEKAMKENQPGQLVCMRSKENYPAKLISAPISSEGDDGTEEETRRLEIRRKVSITQLSSTRPVGCCPAGNPFGTVYRPGFACCNDTIIDVSKQFCCTMKSRTLILSLDEDGLNYCHPLDGVPYCRMEDFEMNQNPYMTFKCRNDSNNKPQFCEFFCPTGSRPMNGIMSAECSHEGIWNSKPICCQGCGEDFKLDLWFLIQVPDNKDTNKIKNLKEFLKEFLTYLPLSQETVRVGFDLITDKSGAGSAVWDLTSHNAYADASSTIDTLLFGDPGSRIGEGLTWMGQNGFTPTKGDRGDVDNIVVAVLSDPSHDPIFEGARLLREQTEVITIAIGKDITIEDLSVIASSTDNVYRVDNTTDLKRLALKLHGNICGEDCL